MKKIKKIKGFVMNRTTGHASYAYKQKKTMVSSLGFTHNKFDKSEKRILHKNIDPYDNTDCYVKLKIEKQPYNKYRYKSDYSNYRFHEKDKPLINSIINKKRR
ncbi:MAG: hypothetical protein IJB10_04185 [Clostridia bacterium]|nr:hypothetical protein [Clostridia bacterium]